MTSYSSARFITSFSDFPFTLKLSGMSTPSVNTSTTRRPCSSSSLSMPMSTAFHSGVGPSFLQIVAQNLLQHLSIRREVDRIDLDRLREAADPRLVLRSHRAHERLRRLLLELEVRLHAAAAIEQHDDGDRLNVVGKQRQLLPLPVVVDGEFLARQIGDQALAFVGDGRVDSHGAVAADERGRLRLLGGDNRRNRRSSKDDGARDPGHGDPIPGLADRWYYFTVCGG